MRILCTPCCVHTELGGGMERMDTRYSNYRGLDYHFAQQCETRALSGFSTIFAAFSMSYIQQKGRGEAHRLYFEYNYCTNGNKL